VLDAPPPNDGSIAALVEIAGDPDRVVTVSNHDDARRAGAHVNFEMISDPVPLEQLLVEYGALAAAGEFAMPIARTFPFADWRTAVEASLTGRARGKLVLLLDD
jgi:NADPH:quinone reductase-like Zn-dependent oxidoreductase